MTLSITAHYDLIALCLLCHRFVLRIRNCDDTFAQRFSTPLLPYEKYHHEYNKSLLQLITHVFKEFDLLLQSLQLILQIDIVESLCVSLLQNRKRFHTREKQ